MSHFLIFFTRVLSSFVGCIAEFRPPAAFNQLIIRIFIKLYHIDLREVAQPLRSFNSLGEFFLRNLVPAARPIAASAAGVVCSPVDGVMRCAGPISPGTDVLVKGQTFDWCNFLLCPKLEEEFKGGTFFNFYLSPKDYHHVHFPVTGKVKEFIHHPGGLLPVNDWSIGRFPNLFCFNERIVTVVEGKGFRYLIIMIGALNVGSMKLAFDEGFKRSFFAMEQVRKNVQMDRMAEAGDSFGSFRLGSSVVCVFPAGGVGEISVKNGETVTFGSRIASLTI